MQRLLLGLVPAVLLLFAACGGGDTTSSSNTPGPGGATTAAPQARLTAAPTSAAPVTSAPAATAGPSATVQATAPASQPALPPGTTAVADYYIVPTNLEGQASALFKLDITQAVPSGATTSWYTYDGGQWVNLGTASIFNGTPQIAEGSFSPVPTNLIVLATQ